MKPKTLVKAALILTVLAILCAVFLILPATGAEAAPSLHIAYCNLSFENEVHLLYAVPTDEVNAQLLVWHDPQEDYSYGTQDAIATVSARNYNINGVLHTVFSYDGLAAKQMADVVYVRAYVNNEGTESYGRVDKYSILEYVYSMLGKTGGMASSNESFKQMLSQMLTYGATAQTYFNYRADRPADGDWVQVKLKGGTLEDGFTYGLYLPGDVATLTAPETNADGWVFAHWADESATVIGETATLFLTVGAVNQTYTAVYREPVLYSEGLTFYSNGDGTCHVSGIGTCTDLDVMIPPVSPEGDEVTGIGVRAFKDCSSLTSITIPNSVTSIGENAFSIYLFQQEGGVRYVDTWAVGCYDKSVTSITLRAGTKGIGDNAFFNRRMLTSITIPDSVTSIGCGAFKYGSSLTSITIPDSVKRIGEEAFSGCTSLIQNEGGVHYVDTWVVGCDTSVTSVSLRAGTKGIGDSAFSGCSSLTSIAIPDSVMSIGDSAFYNCGSLTSITLPNGVTNIGNSAFYGCSSLTSITLPNGVTSIGNSAFYGCSSLTSITVPSGVTRIGTYAFYKCSNLTSITIPSGVTRIGNGTFLNCSSLTSIAIPDSVTSIGVSAFSGCTNLIQKEDGVHYVDTWVVDCDTSVTSVTLRAGTKGIGGSAFEGCRSLTSIVIPGSVTSIGEYAFYYCIRLPSITIPDGVTIIGDYAFYHCSSLPSITIPSGVTRIGDRAFYWCSDLTSITIPDSVTSIGEYAFYFCSDLTSITIPDSVTSIGEYAFYYCSSLPSITIPSGVKGIGTHVFSGCNSLTSITVSDENPVYHASGNCLIETGSKILLAGCQSSIIPTDGSVTSIGDYAFLYCGRLTSITIPDGVTSIGKYAFSGCSGLTSISISDSVRSIGDYAFESCSLTSITLPSGVRSIGAFAFQYCSSLTSITISNSVRSIGWYAFSYCRNLTTITFQGTTAEWCAISGINNDWNSSTGTYTIYCTDGEIAKDGPVTLYPTE